MNAQSRGIPLPAPVQLHHSMVEFGVSTPAENKRRMGEQADNGLADRIRVKITGYGVIPENGKGYLNSTQMKLGQKQVTSELAAFEREQNPAFAPKIMEGHRKTLSQMLSKNGFNEIDAYCLIYGDYPRGYLGQALMACYNTVKVIDGYVICIADTAYARVRNVAGIIMRDFKSEGDVDLIVRGDDCPDYVEQYENVDPATKQKQIVRVPSPLLGSGPQQAAQASAPTQDEKSHSRSRTATVVSTVVSARALTPGVALGSGGISHRPPRAGRTGSMMDIGMRFDGQPRAHRAATLNVKAHRVESCCSRVKSRLTNTYIFHGLKWTWNHILPDVVKEDITEEVRTLCKEPVKEAVRWGTRAIAAVIVGAIAKRLGIIS